MRHVNVYPTVQFLYSHHIRAEYIDQEVKDALNVYKTDPAGFHARFMTTTRPLPTSLPLDSEQ